MPAFLILSIVCLATLVILFRVAVWAVAGVLWLERRWRSRHMTL